MTLLQSHRRCARPDCARPAAASLTYEYTSSTVWIDLLIPQTDPQFYDLCGAHAARLRVPHGWRLLDRRETAGVLH